MTYRDAVYDVTSYLSDHPGGDRLLIAAGGSDATEAFDDVGHSEDAEETMEGMKVGSLSGWVTLLPSALLWLFRKTERKAVETRSETALDRNKYRPLTLIEKDKVGKNAWRLRMAFPDQRSRSGLAVGQHISLRASIAGKTVIRSYTPTSRPTHAGSLDLTIKVYEDGVMGNHLQDRSLGEPIHVRGPHGRFHYRRNASKKLVCIAGGSGITPMFNVIQEICLDERDHTEVILLYASRSEDDTMMKRELERLKMVRPSKLEVEYLVSRPAYGSGLEPARFSGDYLAERLGALDDDTKYLVCGPDAMVDMVSEGLTGLNAEADVHIF
ncbi:hypothetical protein M409DRAFT_65918 [Zasmidium cellare ATCC 36951]|uniref:Cytochrome-b5 reductase n=1 Tax=Zasmidium cellare ATCC 36951 TaxID=1080233 RepID=A0A6A6CPZ3_ZASCE|nr:uncharacterized protein M409DRAFT_65918 [Zasmidium cellare ATCC 36951]KAF2167839.1 hypothetical protein M409DRAFT_65918 [Zasmidium cellare ATCC 36951]